jgi:quinol-cytochrome oxidoreductase complex cytochrome b subunit
MNWHKILKIMGIVILTLPAVVLALGIIDFISDHPVPIAQPATASGRAKKENHAFNAWFSFSAF